MLLAVSWMRGEKKKRKDEESALLFSRLLRQKIYSIKEKRFHDKLIQKKRRCCFFSSHFHLKPN